MANPGSMGPLPASDFGGNLLGMIPSNPNVAPGATPETLTVNKQWYQDVVKTLTLILQSNRTPGGAPGAFPEGAMSPMPGAPGVPVVGPDGQVTDPQVPPKLSGAKKFGNVMKKIALAPFNLLGKLFGIKGNRNEDDPPAEN
jgi:hypothetical protein